MKLVLENMTEDNYNHIEDYIQSIKAYVEELRQREGEKVGSSYLTQGDIKTIIRDMGTGEETVKVIFNFKPFEPQI
jgi:ribulose 1,5-bisphosphate carboxylase large subunit-like protein